MGLQIKNTDKFENSKREYFNFNEDVEGTLQFGEVVPLQVTPIEVGDEKHHFKFNTVLRMSPLINPVFGRIMYKVTHHFISLREVFTKGPDLLAELPTNVFKAVSSSRMDIDSSIPTVFPRAEVSALFALLLREGRSTWSLYKRSGHNVNTNTWNVALPSGTNLNDGLLTLHFGGSSLYSQNNGIVEASDFNYYRYADFNLDDQNVPQDVMTPESADFQSFATDGDDTLLMFKLTKKGRRLYKILTGLGLTLSFTNTTRVSLLPLFAFYKAWFDFYAVPQYQCFADTACSRLIKRFSDTDNNLPLSLSWQNDYDTVVDMKLFFNELSEVGYIDNVDFVSSLLPADGNLPTVDALTKQINTNIEMGQFKADDFLQMNRENELDGTLTKAEYALNSVSLDLLKRLYVASHQDASIGNNLRERLIARGYETLVNEIDSKFLGSFSFPAKVSDIESTVDNYDAQTQQGKPLGAYSGKGYGQRLDVDFTCEPKELGFVISLCTIYPITKCVNGLASHFLSTTSYNWFNGKFDGLSFESVRRCQIGHLTGTEYVSNNVRENDLFGYAPRYLPKKVKTSNRLFGNFNLKSERNSILPYSLDKLIVENENPSHDQSVTGGMMSFKTNDNSQEASYMPTAGLIWRKITDDDLWNGNYNRIFALDGALVTPSVSVNLHLLSNPLPDNFIVQTEIEHEAWIKMIPVEDSWQTEDSEDPKPRMSVDQ